VREALFHEFANRYFPGAPAAGHVDAKVAAEHAGMMVGNYNASRRFETSFMSLLYFFMQTKVIANPDGTLSVSSAASPSGIPWKWVEIEPFVWRQVGGKDLLAARVEDGQVNRFSYGEGSPFEVFDRAPGWKSGSWMPLFVVALAALVLNSLAWPISALTRRHYRAAYKLQGTEARAHRWVRIASVAAVVVFLGWTLLDVTVLSNLGLSSKIGGWVILFEILAPFAFVGGAAVGIWSALVMLRSQRGWLAKAWSVWVALSLVVALWVALAFHLIMFRVMY
jgi:hypothetical protein